MAIFHSRTRLTQDTLLLEQVLQPWLSPLFPQTQLDSALQSCSGTTYSCSALCLDQVYDAAAAQLLPSVGSSSLSSPHLCPTIPFFREIVEAGEIEIGILQMYSHVHAVSLDTTDVVISHSISSNFQSIVTVPNIQAN